MRYSRKQEVYYEMATNDSTSQMCERKMKSTKLEVGRKWIQHNVSINLGFMFLVKD